MRWARALGNGMVLLWLFAGAATELLLRRPATRRARAEWLHRLCRRAVTRLDVTVRNDGAFPRRGALICNHLGYLDIVALAALYPCVFVSKAEIARWPFIGWLATMAGTVFVQRGRGGSAAAAGEQMREAMQGDVPVVFFPEGTTGNGEQVLPFHSGLLGETLLSGGTITAAAIRYGLREKNGSGVTVGDDVAYWGDINFVRHVVRFLGLRGVEVDVRFAPGPIRFAAEALTNRKTAAGEARDAVVALWTEVRDETAPQSEAQAP